MIDCSRCIHYEVCSNRFSNDGCEGTCGFYLQDIIPQGDLISRSELKKAYFNAINETSIGEVSIIDLIDNAPSVNFIISPDYVTELQNINKELIKQLEELERPQGEWIDYDNTFYKCPDCGYLLEKCCPQCQNKVVLPKGGAE